MYYTFTGFIIFFYTFSVIHFALYEEYMNYLISFIKLSDVSLTFTCKRIISNLRSICLGVNILSFLLFVAFIGNIPPLKALRVNSRPY